MTANNDCVNICTNQKQSVKTFAFSVAIENIRIEEKEMMSHIEQISFCNFI